MNVTVADHLRRLREEYMHLEAEKEEVEKEKERIEKKYQELYEREETIDCLISALEDAADDHDAHNK